MYTIPLKFRKDDIFNEFTAFKVKRRIIFKYITI